MPPPYTDHHVHVMATAAARLSVDVSAASSIAELGRIIEGAGGTGWVRAWGYEEWALADRRHPTRDDLDRYGGGRPVVLHHRTGHAAVLNSAALSEVGEPGHPDGVLVDRHDLLARVPRLAPASLAAAVAAVSAEWEAAGIGAVTDATHTNRLEEIELFRAWRAGGELRQQLTAMVGTGAVGSVPPFGHEEGGVVVGPVKLMPGPDRGSELGAEVAAAHEAGFPVAVHVLDFDVLDATLRAFEGSIAPDGTADRIEHNALCLPDQVDRIASCRATVVVNPSFLLHRRRKYELEVAAVERQWLIRMGSLRRAGIRLLAGSDSPVVPARPAEIISAAASHPFAPSESIPPAEAERMLMALPMRSTEPPPAWG